MPDSLLQEIVCCLGQPVAGNPTQFMMERAFAAASLDWRYLTLEVAPEDLEAAINGIRAMGFRGANLTIPHKVAVIPFLDELSEVAELMGAVNCIHNTGGKLVGENTDGKGFVRSLKEVVDPAGKHIVLLGAGGAARAIAVELALLNPSSLIIVNRSADRGQELADLIASKSEAPVEFVHLSGDYILNEHTDIVINATSIGLGDADARVPMNLSALNSSAVATDVVFNPPTTRFLREAEELGCKTIDGLGMLVNQGVHGFKIWTGIDPEATVMREALEEYLEI